MKDSLSLCSYSRHVLHRSGSIILRLAIWVAMAEAENLLTVAEVHQEPKPRAKEDHREKEQEVVRILMTSWVVSCVQAAYCGHSTGCFVNLLTD